MPIIIRYWFNIILIGILSYASYLVLMASHISYESVNNIDFLYLVSPWLLLYASLKSWHRCMIWRKMLANTHTPQGLARGQLHTPKKVNSPSILERVCALLVLLSVAAILNELNVPHIGLWISIIVITWLLFGSKFRRIG